MCSQYSVVDFKNFVAYPVFTVRLNVIYLSGQMCWDICFKYMHLPRSLRRDYEMLDVYNTYILAGSSFGMHRRYLINNFMKFLNNLSFLTRLNDDQNKARRFIKLYSNARLLQSLVLSIKIEFQSSLLISVAQFLRNLTPKIRN